MIAEHKIWILICNSEGGQQAPPNIITNLHDIISQRTAVFTSTNQNLRSHEWKFISIPPLL
jgi:hypothetical protein